MMTNLLTEESPQVYHPTLATWIGINEAMFLAQLNFILTKNESVGKFADGRKWYRDKPRDFVIKYFPFWDEGIVKRVIDNLRADGILLARSDLNKDPKDRSLWYTINHEAIERLTGPVERILSKSAKRKEARAARKSKEDNSNEYTKVQNVLLNDNSTNCTFDPGTKCTDEEVQNVPTPKDSLSKTPLPKEGASKTTRPPAIPAMAVFFEITRYFKITKFWQEEAGRIVGDNPTDLDFWRKVVIGWTGKYPTVHNIEGMLDFFKRREIPGQQNGAKPNGHKPTKQQQQIIPPSPAEQDRLLRMQAALNDAA